MKKSLIHRVESTIITDPKELTLLVTPSEAEVEIYSRSKMLNLVFARQQLPALGTPSIFCAGPTARTKEGKSKSWRIEAVKHLQDLNFTGSVYIPEDQDFTFQDWEKNFPYDEQVEWEHQALERATCIMFWIPRDMSALPGLTTNDEFGTYKRSGRVVLGTPPEAVSVRYQRWHAKRLGIPTYNTLADTCSGAVQFISQR